MDDLWFGDVKRPPLSVEQVRHQALWALAPRYQKGSFDWLQYHLSLFTYKPGWSWSVTPGQPWDPGNMLTIKVIDPNRQLAKQLEQRRIPRMRRPDTILESEPSIEYLTVRSALHPDWPAQAVQSTTTAPIPPYADSEDELARWFLYTLEHAEMQMAGTWLRYRNNPS